MSKRRVKQARASRCLRKNRKNAKQLRLYFVVARRRALSQKQKHRMWVDIFICKIFNVKWMSKIE